MKKNLALPAIGTFCLFMFLSEPEFVRAQESPGLYGEISQESIDERSRQLDLKLQLLDTKLDLLDSKIKLWETKPGELDIRLNEIDERIDELAFEPTDLNDQFLRIDSLIAELQASQLGGRESEEINVPGDELQPDLSMVEHEFFPVFRSAIMLDPVRLFEGTFCLSYERLITDRFSLGISGLATYATEDGLTNYFFANQELAYFDDYSDSYIDYEGESIAGGGFILQCRDYLLADYPSKRRPPAGLYAAPQILYRRLLITGEQMEYVDDEWVKMVIKQRLNILTTGVLIGVRMPFKKVLFLDFYLGGHIKFSKYDGEAGLTKYKEWFNIDFSGVFPTAGIGIGILK